MVEPNPSAFDIVIEPTERLTYYWRDVWRYRELFFVFAWRDIAVRYKQTVIGVSWALLRPISTMLILTIVFNKMIRLNAPGSVPYPLLVLAAMLPWQFFSTALAEASSSLTNNASLISKVYFPRLIVPAAAVITSFIDFLLTLAVMMLLMLWYRFMPDWRFFTLPAFVLLGFGITLGVGLWLGALNVKYRDIRHIVPFIVQFGLYISPVGFSSTIVPERWRLLYDCNPLVGVIEGFRWALLRGDAPLSVFAVSASVVITVVFCISGFWYFRRMEETFADVI